ncbi:hypothetical protein ABE044_12855 [Bacillus altitudinis]|uniref:hypothetical protein n=1 Tax=Bacillus altitudinis TaxID=293387 RepID=UPI003D19893C
MNRDIENNLIEDFKYIQEKFDLEILFQELDEILEYVLDDFNVDTFIESIGTLGSAALARIISVTLASDDLEEVLSSHAEESEIQTINSFMLRKLKFIKAKYGGKFEKEVRLIKNELKIDKVRNNVITSDYGDNLFETKIKLINGDKIITRNEAFDVIQLATDIIEVVKEEELKYSKSEKELIEEKIDYLVELLEDIQSNL